MPEDSIIASDCIWHSLSECTASKGQTLSPLSDIIMRPLLFHPGRVLKLFLIIVLILESEVSFFLYISSNVYLCPKVFRGI